MVADRRTAVAVAFEARPLADNKKFIQQVQGSKRRRSSAVMSYCIFQIGGADRESLAASCRRRDGSRSPLIIKRRRDAFVRDPLRILNGNRFSTIFTNKTKLILNFDSKEATPFPARSLAHFKSPYRRFDKHSKDKFSSFRVCECVRVFVQTRGKRLFRLLNFPPTLNFNNTPPPN